MYNILGWTRNDNKIQYGYKKGLYLSYNPGAHANRECLYAFLLEDIKRLNKKEIFITISDEVFLNDNKNVENIYYKIMSDNKIQKIIYDDKDYEDENKLSYKIINGRRLLVVCHQHPEII